MARRTRRKKTRFAENPPSRNHHWPVPLPKDWQIIPLDYPRRRRSQRFAHCAFTVRSRITRRTRTSSATNVHTRTLAKTGRLNGCFSLDSRAHTHTRISFRPFLIDATRDANTNRVKRKRKLRRDHLAHVPRHVFHARVWIRARDHALVDRLSLFLLFLRIILEREINSDERDNLFTTVFVLYIIRGREKIEIYLLERYYLSRILFVAPFLQDIGVINRVSSSTGNNSKYNIYIYIYGWRGLVFLDYLEYLILRYCNNVCLP